MDKIKIGKDDVLLGLIVILIAMIWYYGSEYHNNYIDEVTRIDSVVKSVDELETKLIMSNEVIQTLKVQLADKDLEIIDLQEKIKGTRKPSGKNFDSTKK